MNQTFFTPDSLFLSQDQRTKRWAIPYNFDCLNARVENLLWKQRHAIQGKAILDLGSHMGTFAYAALKIGAKYVHCVDTEKDLIFKGERLFELHGIDKSRYRFEVKEATEFMKSIKKGTYETVLCLGLLYYCSDPFGFLRSISKIAPKSILIDTFTANYAAVQGTDSTFIQKNITEGTFDLPIMLTIPTQSQKKDYLLPSSYSKNMRPLSLTHYPSIRLLETWFEALNLNWERITWDLYTQGKKTWKDLLTQKQKKGSHWADVYASNLRASFWLQPK